MDAGAPSMFVRGGPLHERTRRCVSAFVLVARLTFPCRLRERRQPAKENGRRRFKSKRRCSALRAKRLFAERLRKCGSTTSRITPTSD
jgi:hypothetical protein